MQIRPLTLAALSSALRAGWQQAQSVRLLSGLYAAIFALAGVLPLGALWLAGWTPFVLAAAGGFMLLAPISLAGFFGIAKASDAGRQPAWGDIVAGFREAAPALWALALVCALLFMIFVTDAAILYAYLVGGEAVGFAQWAPHAGVGSFIRWSAISGLVVAFLLYCISAFSVPLLCERRSGLVGAVICSVRLIFGHFPVAILWAFCLSTAGIAAALLLPLLPVVLPWLAYASRALYREVLPIDAEQG